MGAEDEGLYLRMQTLSSSDFGDQRHGDAWLEITPDGVVLGSFFDDHPFQRYFRLAVAGPVAP